MDSVQWKGREIENPILRFLVGFCAMVLSFVALMAAMLAIPLSVIMGVLGVLVMAVLIPVSFPLHLVLRLLGRKGFLSTGESEGFSYVIDTDAFRKAP
jgi:hypothetical protein